MIECSKCGTENHFDGAIFCKSCGAELSSRVAVKVADPPATLRRDAQPPARQPDTPRERSETDFVVTDLQTDELEAGGKPAIEPLSGGGFDQLLKRYENDHANRSAGEEVVESALTSDLGIESASDYLMRQQEDVGSDQIENVMPRQNPCRQHPDPDAAATQPVETIRKHAKQMQHSEEHAISVDEKNRLLSSLQKTLEEQDATAVPKVEDESAPRETPLKSSRKSGLYPRRLKFLPPGSRNCAATAVSIPEGP